MASFHGGGNQRFALLDPELRLVEINNAGIEMFPQGTSKKDLLEKNLLEITPNAALDATYEKFMEVLKTGKPYTVEDYIPPLIYGEKVAFMGWSVFKTFLADHYSFQRSACHAIKI